MIGKLTMFAFVVLGLRWLAASAPVSERSLGGDPHDSARSGQRYRSDRDFAASTRRAAPRVRGDERAPDREPLVSDADQERLKELGGQVWTIARPVLRVAAVHALDGLASLLRTAADKLPQALPDGDATPADQRQRQ